MKREASSGLGLRTANLGNDIQFICLGKSPVSNLSLNK